MPRKLQGNSISSASQAGSYSFIYLASPAVQRYPGISYQVPSFRSDISISTVFLSGHLQPLEPTRPNAQKGRPRPKRDTTVETCKGPSQRALPRDHPGTLPKSNSQGGFVTRQHFKRGLGIGPAHAADVHPPSIPPSAPVTATGNAFAHIAPSQSQSTVERRRRANV